MKNTSLFYEQENGKILDSYKRGLLEIKGICQEAEVSAAEGNEKGIYDFFNHSGKLILKLSDIESSMNDEYFTSRSFVELNQENTSLYEELMVKNYDTSYCNPKYAVELFGDGMGQLLSFFYVSIREGISHAYRNRIFRLNDTVELFIEAYKCFKAHGCDYNLLKDIFISPFLNEDKLLRDRIYFNEEGLNLEYTFYSNIVMNCDLTDLRYLFRYDDHIGDNEIKLAEFLAKYPVDKLKKLSKATVDAYLRGFVTDNKNRGDRNRVRLIYFIGQERVIKYLVEEFKTRGIDCAFQFAESTRVNKQFDYDHRYDKALYLSENYTELREKTYKEALELAKHHFDKSAGPMIYEVFGEEPFSPEIKKDLLKLTKEQETLLRSHQNVLNEIYNQYEPNENTNFCIAAIPTPEIGKDFESIFEDTLSINMMDNASHEIIQQKIIDVLDEGEYVHIKGKDGNKTDIKVMLQELRNPDKETNFFNMVAESNMPLGEVFTSPRLKGTDGILHIKDIYLDLKYRDLTLHFKDGYVVDYNCGNFADEEENKKYVFENLMELHEKLPLGEFAIGTNTEAYVMAKKYNIIELLTILIIEKMGPHFAIGDTCYSWSEDLPTYNVLNGKEVVSRENEHSAMRKESIDKAYTGVHTDITLPYEEIEFISVVTKEGTRTDIIRDGMFALAGTTELNEPLLREL